MEFRKALMSAATARKIADKKIKNAEAWHEIVAMITAVAHAGYTSFTLLLEDSKLKYLTEEDMKKIRDQGYTCSIENDMLTISWE
jgi:hypothetical protein